MIPTAPIIEETKTQYIIKCPYCDKKHYHGKIEGERSRHCYIPLRSKKLKKQVEERTALYNSSDYYIKWASPPYEPHLRENLKKP